MPLRTYEQHPIEKVSYPVEVQDLGSNTIGVVSGTSDPVGLTFHSVTASGNRVTALIGGGVADTTYKIEISINLSNGELRVGQWFIKFVDVAP